MISFLPPFPRWSGDNRAHLQAFRNLWYLAIEPRLLVATDIDTNQLVSLPVKTAAKEELSKGEQNFTPLLLPNRQLTGPIESATLRYWPASIASRSTAERAGALTSAASLSRASSSTTSQILFVRRKTAHLDYTADPHGSRSLSTRAVETAPMEVSSDATGLIGPGLSELREAMRGFAGAGKHRELIRSLCQASEPSKVGQDEESKQCRITLAHGDDGMPHHGQDVHLAGLYEHCTTCIVARKRRLGVDEALSRYPLCRRVLPPSL